jgi:hypothetical protein
VLLKWLDNLSQIYEVFIITTKLELERGLNSNTGFAMYQLDNIEEMV